MKTEDVKVGVEYAFRTSPRRAVQYAEVVYVGDKPAPKYRHRWTYITEHGTNESVNIWQDHAIAGRPYVITRRQHPTLETFVYDAWAVQRIVGEADAVRTRIAEQDEQQRIEWEAYAERQQSEREANEALLAVVNAALTKAGRRTVYISGAMRNQALIGLTELAEILGVTQ